MSLWLTPTLILALTIALVLMRTLTRTLTDTNDWEVISATNLVNKDTFGASDPWCLLEIEGAESSVLEDYRHPTLTLTLTLTLIGLSTPNACQLPLIGVVG